MNNFIRTVITCVMVTGLALAGGPEKKETRTLFNGEMAIKPTGIFTYAHWYAHPTTKQRIIIVGTSHGGDSPYFEKIAEVLKDADVVLYERPNKQPRETRSTEETLTQMDAILASAPVNAILPALQLYYEQAEKYLQLTREGNAFDYTATGWEAGDEEFFERMKSNPELEKLVVDSLQRGLAAVPQKHTKHVLTFIRTALEQMREKKFTKRDFGESFVVFWSDQRMVNAFLSAIASERDELMFEKFDRMVKEKPRHVIGIKFGAAHIANQRRLLERRGYRLTRSVELRNLAF